jgi:hypothetical protein
MAGRVNAGEKIGDKMADTEDPIQQAADAAIKTWADSVRSAQLEHRPGTMAERVASELTRIRFEMTAIRKLLQRREKINGGEF